MGLRSHYTTIFKEMIAFHYSHLQQSSTQENAHFHSLYILHEGIHFMPHACMELQNYKMIRPKC